MTNYTEEAKSLFEKHQAVAAQTVPVDDGGMTETTWDALPQAIKDGWVKAVQDMMQRSGGRMGA